MSSEHRQTWTMFSKHNFAVERIRFLQTTAKSSVQARRWQEKPGGISIPETEAPEVTVDVSRGAGLKESVWASKRIWLVPVKILSL